MASTAMITVVEVLPEWANSALYSIGSNAMMDHQGMSINAMVAAVAADYLVQILLTQHVRKFATYFSLEGNLPFNHRYLVPNEFEAIFNQKGRRAKKAQKHEDGA